MTVISTHHNSIASYIFLHPLLVVIHNKTNICPPDHTDILNDIFCTNTFRKYELNPEKSPSYKHHPASCIARFGLRSQAKTEYSKRKL